MFLDLEKSFVECFGIPCWQPPVTGRQVIAQKFASVPEELNHNRTPNAILRQVYRSVVIKGSIQSRKVVRF